MSTNKPEESRELKSLLEETVAGLGGTDTSYVQLLHYLSNNNELHMPSRFMPGQMVFFKYKPQDTRFVGSSSAYDVFPLVIITEVHRDGFEGLNLHFIAKRWRRMLFNAIEQSLPIRRAGDPSLTRLGTTYRRIKGPKKFKFFKPCYRRYVKSGFRKRPILIPSDFWDVLVDVDLALFVKGRKMGIRRMSYNSAISSENNL
jgi:hypothetical protein